LYAHLLFRLLADYYEDRARMARKSSAMLFVTRRSLLPFRGVYPASRSFFFATGNWGGVFTSNRGVLLLLYTLWPFIRYAPKAPRDSLA